MSFTSRATATRRLWCSRTTLTRRTLELRFLQRCLPVQSQRSIEPPSLVVFNSCNSESQAVSLVQGIVPFAIGMSDTVDDGDAIRYAARLYGAIANGQSIGGAHELAARIWKCRGRPAMTYPPWPWPLALTPVRSRS